jgi:quinol-cytochrome oxidoreductase complex cytochrome b subunit
MKEHKNKTRVHPLLVIISGLGISIGTFILLIAIFIGLGLFGWSDGGEKEYLERLEKSTNITLISSVIIALVTGVYSMFRMNRSKQKEIDSSLSDKS